MTNLWRKLALEWLGGIGSPNLTGGMVESKPRTRIETAELHHTRAGACVDRGLADVGYARVRAFEAGASSDERRMRRTGWTADTLGVE